MPIKRPNIILCNADQLRSFAVGCYGNDFVRTPNLDRLAAGGVRFETAVTNYPVCMAARSVMLSGQHNRTATGGVANVMLRGDPMVFPQYPAAGRLHLRQTTLGECLRGAGYETMAIGKWHIHSWPHDVGFDHYVIPRVSHCHSGQSFTEDGRNEFVPTDWSVDFEAGRVEQYLLERRRADRPFFLYYSISPPHCPLADAPEKYRKMYDPAAVPLRPNVSLDSELPNRDRWFKIYRHDFRHYNLQLPFTDELPEGYGFRELTAEYYGLCTWADDAVGRMLAALDDAALLDDTIVVFTADHGDMLGSHNRVQKGGTFEEEIRVPMIVRWPAGLGAGRVADGQVASLVDLAPTLLELAGLDAPEHMQGRSLAAALTGRGCPDSADPATWSIVETWGSVAVRTPLHLYELPLTNARDHRDWTPASTTPGLAEAPRSFYEVAADPYQFRNLAGTGEQSEAAATLDAFLRQWDARTPWLNGPA